MSIFTMIAAGEVPGRFIWADDVCFVIATIEPINPGHVLVIPREEVATYWDADPEVVAHMSKVAQHICKAQIEAFGAVRSGLIVAGFDVPHLHVHVVPLTDQGELTFARAKAAPAEEIDEASRKLRQALVDAGHGQFVPADMSSIK